MRGGVIGSLCFLAFLCSSGKGEEQAAPEDVIAAIAEETSVPASDTDERSGAFAQSSATSNGGSAKSDAAAESNGGSASAQSHASSSSNHGSAQSKADAVVDIEAASLGSGNNRGYPYRVPGSSSAQASAEAQAHSSPGLGNFQANGMPSFFTPGLAPFPVSSGGLSEAEAEAKASAGNLNAVQTPYSNMPLYGSPWSSTAQAEAAAMSGANSAQAQAEANAQAHNGDPSSYGQKLYSPYGPSSSQADSVAGALSENSYNPLPGFPKALRSQAQAQAQSTSQMLGGWGSPYNPMNSYPPYNVASNTAQAQSSAQTNNAGSSFNPYSPYTPFSPSSTSQAQAQSNVGLNAPYNPYSPYSVPPYNSGSNSASAQADASANTGSNSPYILGPKYSPNTGSSMASANAEATANSAGNSQYNPSVPFSPGFPLSPQSGSSQATAEALAQTSSGANLYGPGLQPSGYYDLGLAIPAQSEANENAMANSASSSASAFSEANSRVLQPHEYFYPNNVPGVESPVRCSRLHEMWYMRAVNRQCMVCICVQNMKGYLSPMCASCAGCQAPPAPFPEPPPNPVIIPVSPEPFPEPSPFVPTLPPTTQVTCSPLPSGQHFTNPLNPCQLCICRESVNMLGKSDVQIECQENPQCVLPPDATTLPPLPDIPIPLPLPMCEKFPPNVLFPHPSNKCKLCKCSLELTEFGVPEQQITCYPTPGCVTPQPGPIPDPPGTLPPVPFPVPPGPYPTPPPFPDFVTEPIIPWPPMTMPAPPAPGPLPGPAPHESCRPFPPNQPFQHPWDECQVCVCTEATAIGLITVEVNCYTKKSCCFEPGDDYIPVTLPPPTPYPIPGTIIIRNNICEYKTFGVEFINPDDNCQICVCAPVNNIVSASCKRSLAPECLSYTGGNAIAEAYSSAETGGNTGGRPLPFPSKGQGPSLTQSSAEANELASSLQGSNLLGQYQMPRPYPSQAMSQSQAAAQAQGNGQSSATAEAAANSNPQVGFMPGQYQVGRPRVYPSQANSQSQAQAQSQVQTYGSGKAKAVADAESNSAVYHVPSQNYLYPGQFNAESLAPSTRNKYPMYGQYDSKTQALANALMNSNQNHPMYSQGVPASSLYPSMYTRASQEITPLYQPGQFKDSLAQAQAQSVASGLDAQSQAASSASSDGRYQTKSGNPEDMDFLYLIQ